MGSLLRISVIALLVAGTLCVFATSVRADTVVLQYDLNTGVSSTASDLGVSGSDLASGGPTSPLTSARSSGGNWFMRFQGVSTAISTFPTTEAESQAASMYFTFTLTPTSAVNLTQLTIDLLGTAGDPYTASVFLADESGDRISDTTTFDIPGGSSNTDMLTVDLSGMAAYQNLSSVTTFRVYSYMPSGRDVNGVSPSPGDQIIRFDNVTVLGDVVPEPASASLLMGGAMLLVGRRGRKRVSPSVK
jgi:hypothetical protein